MNRIGTKLHCRTCGAQCVVTKGGKGVLACHREPMEAVSGSVGRQTDSDSTAKSEHYDPFYD